MSCKKHPNAEIKKEEHHHHPYKLTCSVCGSFIGWGKSDRTIELMNDRQSKLKPIIVKAVNESDWTIFDLACSLYGAKHLGLVDMEKYNNLLVNNKDK